MRLYSNVPQLPDGLQAPVAGVFQLTGTRGRNRVNVSAYQ